MYINWLGFELHMLIYLYSNWIFRQRKWSRHNVRETQRILWAKEECTIYHFRLFFDRQHKHVGWESIDMYTAVRYKLVAWPCEVLQHYHHKRRNVVRSSVEKKSFAADRTDSDGIQQTASSVDAFDYHASKIKELLMNSLRCMQIQWIQETKIKTYFETILTSYLTTSGAYF